MSDKKKMVHHFSKGMKQRLTFARAILHSPTLLFLDEPTSELDPATGDEIHKIMLELKNQGTTLFLTTHNMEEATKLCDDVILLNEGKIVEKGNPKELCRKHNSKNEIQILLKNQQILLYENSSDYAEKIANCFREEKVISIHSSEPNLETVFIKLTGRGFS